MRRRVAAAALIASALVLGLLPSIPAQAAAASASLVVAPRDGGLLTTDGDLVLDVEVTNTGSTTLPAGQLAFSLSQAPVASATTLLQSIAAPESVLLGLLVPVTAKTSALASGASERERVRITHSQLSGILSDQSGASLLYARFRAGSGAGTVQTVAESAVTRMAAGFSGRIDVGTIVPITAPANTTGVVDVDAQASLTEPGGAWDAALAAARTDPRATIALDPEVIASIRLAGTAAPSSATAFLAELAALPNEVVALPYADADLTLERAAGASTTIAPTSFSGATTEPVTAGPGATAAPTPTPSASAASTTQSVADLTDWHWTGPAVAWPVARSTSAATLASLGTGGTTVLLGTGDVRDTRARLSAGPRASVAGTTVLVVDQQSSALLTEAAAGGAEGAAALASLVGALGSDAVSGEEAAVLLTAGRDADSRGLVQALRVLGRAGWIDGTTLTTLAKRPATAVALAPGVVPAARATAARNLIEQEAVVRALGTATTGGTALVAPERLALTGLLSTAWRGNDTGWTSAAADGASSFTRFVGQVAVSQGSAVLYLGNDGDIPVSVVNGLSKAVTIVLHGQPTNGRFQVTGQTRLTIPANASRQFHLPIHSITNGRSAVRLWLETPAGTVIGPTVTRSVTVAAGFETPVAVLLIVALGLLFLTGIYRNVVRPRRRRPRTVSG